MRAHEAAPRTLEQVRASVRASSSMLGALLKGEHDCPIPCEVWPLLQQQQRPHVAVTATTQRQRPLSRPRKSPANVPFDHHLEPNCAG